MRFVFAAAAMLLATSAAVPALADTLSTGTGDGSVQLYLDAFGQSTTSQNGIYDPVGMTGAARTVFASRVYFRFGTTGVFSQFSNSGSASAYAGNDTSRQSVFTIGSDLAATLDQTVALLTDTSNAVTGSLLTQTYSFTNTTGSELVLDLVRYLDGDLNFVGGAADGGGTLVSGGTRVLFETDDAVDPASSSTFVGIYNSGDGIETGYEVGQCCGVLALNNEVFGDTDGDDFTNSTYDVTLNLGRRFTLGVGQSASFVTNTRFGTGLPQDVQVGEVPEPATWATFILGFGLAGGALRRRRSAVSFG